MAKGERKATFGVTRKRAIMASRRSRALALLKAGYSTHEIWEQVPEYQSLKSLEADLRKTLKSMVERPAIEFIGLQFARQQDLLQAVWDEALMGDIKAHEAARATINDQVKLLGLAQTREGESNSDVQIFINHLMGDDTELEDEVEE